ncbi:MAG: hypothetical protein HN757_18245 [Calditrichaeota bacterium]|nr:hypothetical protein [Calditrichota bacterium]
MNFWVDIKGHPNFRVNCEYLPRVGEGFVIGSDTFVGQEGELEYSVVSVTHRIELGISAQDSPLIVLESQLKIGTI